MKVLVLAAAGRWFDGGVRLLRDGDVTALDSRIGSQGRSRTPGVAESPRCHSQVDVSRKKKLTALMKQYDRGIIRCPTGGTSYLVVDAAVRCGFNFGRHPRGVSPCPDAYEIEGLRCRRACP